MLGASIICVDYLVRLFPGKQHFRIQDSSTFLSASLSLSSGVMVFSALYSMLPASKSYLTKGGFSPQAAAWTLIACFLGGAIGIQVISRFFHHFIPSHIVDCDHTHDGADRGDEETAVNRELRDRPTGHHTRGQLPRTSVVRTGRSLIDRHHHIHDSEHTPLLSSSPEDGPLDATHCKCQLAADDVAERASGGTSFARRVSSLVTGAKPSCGVRGPCYGYSEPCGQECAKSMPARKLSSSSDPLRANPHSHPRQHLARHVTAPLPPPPPAPHTTLPLVSEESRCSSPSTSTSSCPPTSPSSLSTNDHDHHHHVPTNAFLSLSLQTSLAIALHKLPEGFITFATNHANPRLGFSVFMALFIHNTTEGFAMALPLFLALQSRPKAMVWSSLLGGISQPLGGGVAAVWFGVARERSGDGDGSGGPGEGVYGGMFAVTGTFDPAHLMVWQAVADM